MKTKGKIFAYIIMLTLSLSVMFYGVYSAMNATLTISGSLGFNPHNSLGSAQIISVDGALNADGTKYTVDASDTTKLINWQDGTPLTLTNPIYLDDISNYDASTNSYKDGIRICPIVITLKLTNNSSFAVKTEAKTGAKLTNTNGEEIAGLTYSYGAIVLAKTGAENNANINETFTVTITPDQNVVQAAIEVTQFSLTIDIERNT